MSTVSTLIFLLRARNGDASGQKKSARNNIDEGLIKLLTVP